MNYKKLVCGALLSISFFQLQALSFVGKTNLANTTVRSDSVNINGRFTFKDLTIQKDLRVNGHVSGNGLQVNNIHINGKSDMQHVTAKECKINGKTDISNSKFSVLRVNGKCDVQNVTVSGIFKVAGKLVAKDVKASEMILHSGSSVLQDVTIEKNLLVDNSSSEWCDWSIVKWFFTCDDKKSHPAEIELKGSTHIKGNVEFKNGNGILYYESTVKIDGKVIGAQVIKR